MSSFKAQMALHAAVSRLLGRFIDPEKLRYVLSNQNMSSTTPVTMDLFLQNISRTNTEHKNMLDMLKTASFDWLLSASNDSSLKNDIFMLIEAIESNNFSKNLADIALMVVSMRQCDKQHVPKSVFTNIERALLHGAEAGPQIRKLFYDKISSTMVPDWKCNLPEDYFLLIQRMPAIVPPIGGGVSIPVLLFRTKNTTPHRGFCNRWVIPIKAGGQNAPWVDWVDAVSTTNPLNGISLENIRAPSCCSAKVIEEFQQQRFGMVSTELDIGLVDDLPNFLKPVLFLCRGHMARKLFTMESANHFGCSFSTYKVGISEEYTKYSATHPLSQPVSIMYYVLTVPYVNKNSSSGASEEIFFKRALIFPAIFTCYWDTMIQQFGNDWIPKCKELLSTHPFHMVEEEGRAFAGTAWKKVALEFLQENPLTLVNALGALTSGKLKEFVQEIFDAGKPDVSSYGCDHLALVHEKLQAAYGGPGTVNKRSKRKPNAVRRELVRALNSLNSAYPLSTATPYNTVDCYYSLPLCLCKSKTQCRTYQEVSRKAAQQSVGPLGTIQRSTIRLIVPRECLQYYNRIKAWNNATRTPSGPRKTAGKKLTLRDQSTKSVLHTAKHGEEQSDSQNKSCLIKRALQHLDQDKRTSKRLCKLWSQSRH